MKTILLVSLALVAFASLAPVASATDHCVGVEGVQELCRFTGPGGAQCYYWKGIVLDGHPFC